MTFIHIPASASDVASITAKIYKNYRFSEEGHSAFWTAPNTPKSPSLKQTGPHPRTKECTTLEGIFFVYICAADDLQLSSTPASDASACDSWIDGRRKSSSGTCQSGNTWDIDT